MLWLQTSEVAARAESIAQAARALMSGDIVVMPTDTVYGVAALPGNSAAIAQLFEAKRRPLSRTIPLLVDSPERAWELAQEPSLAARRLGARFWPGGLTLVVHSRERLRGHVMAPDGSIAIRVPAHPVALELIRACGGALAVTSANRSGEPSARTAIDAAAALGHAVAATLDAGPCPVGRDSTIVDVRGSEPRLLRLGAIGWEEVLIVWQEL